MKKRDLLRNATVLEVGRVEVARKLENDGMIAEYSCLLSNKMNLDKNVYPLAEVICCGIYEIGGEKVRVFVGNNTPEQPSGNPTNPDEWVELDSFFFVALVGEEKTIIMRAPQEFLRYNLMYWDAENTRYLFESMKLM